MMVSQSACWHAWRCSLLLLLLAAGVLTHAQNAGDPLDGNSTTLLARPEGNLTSDDLNSTAVTTQADAATILQDENDGVESSVQALVDAPVQRSRAKAVRMAAAHKREVASAMARGPAAATAAAAAAAIAAAADDTAYAPDTTGVGVFAMNPFYQAIFDRHNSYRSRHQAPGLTWSDTLAAQAAAYAAKCNFAHDPYANAGENLFATSDTSNLAGSLTQAIDLWYDEVRVYNFNSPGFSSATGHFTQVVWVSSTSLGCAVQACSSGLGGTGWASASFVVCRYSPPGNVIGAFQQNVLPASNGPTPPPKPPTSPPISPPSNPPSTPPVSTPSPPPIPPATLPSGYRFASPGCLYSVNQQARLCMENSGYLVLYAGGIPGREVWRPNQATSSFRPYRLALGVDGNLIVTDNLSRQLWRSGTANTGVAPYRLLVLDQGVAVLYDATNRLLWGTNTAGRRR